MPSRLVRPAFVAGLLLALGAALPPVAVAAGPTAPAAHAALAPAQPGPALAAMVSFDAAYIPALAATSAAVQDAHAAAGAREAAQALASAWPLHRQRLASAWGELPAPAWTPALDEVASRIDASLQAVQRGDWSHAHEALEEVRIVLMQARRAQGMDYFVDRLTEFHAPMEALVQAGSAHKATLTSAERAALQRGFEDADALWKGIEAYALAPEAYGLGAAKRAQVAEGLANERAALEALRAALAAGDDARIQQAAVALKPPFARVFTSFGRTAGLGSS